MNVYINNAGEDWIQVTISNPGAEQLDEAWIKAALEAAQVASRSPALSEPGKPDGDGER